MNKILLVIKREYGTRVRKKTFIIMSILGPLLFGSLIIIPILLATRTNEAKVVMVIDESGYFQDNLPTQKNIRFEYLNTTLINALKTTSNDKNEALLYIPNIDIDNPIGILLYTENNLGLEFEGNIEKIIQSEIEERRLKNSGISSTFLDSLKANVEISIINPETGKEGTDAGLSTFAGYIGAFAIYMFIFIYGAQVMRGVAEEKSSRVIEVIISSVKPFQLMLGKILGIAGVVLTQLSIWILLTSTIYAGISYYYSDELKHLSDAKTEQSFISPTTKFDQAEKFGKMSKKLTGINISKLVFCFIFYFLGGYLMYAALFAMVGSAVNSMEDSQQFMLPITIPLIASIVVLGAVLQEPHGTLAFWMSIIPLTSPVVMMMRVPFDVSNLDLLLSMALLIGGFVFTTWLAGRVYRIGILMHGAKVNYKIIWKWLFMKN